LVPARPRPTALPSPRYEGKTRRCYCIQLNQPTRCINLSDLLLVV